MKDREAPMLVVLDSDPDSLAPVAVAQSYSPSTVLLSSWAADPLEIDADVLHSTSADPTISEAIRVAAQRGISWLGMRRSMLPPQELLGELLVATAQHATKGTPGFGVILTEGDKRSFTHILAIVERSHGPISGLLAYAGVALADAAGAQLDILVIGAGDENPHTEDELDAIAINREQELYEAAVQRAVEAGLSVNWITAASVTDPWPVVADQLSQHPYDLVIDDLGDISLARVRQRSSIEQALASQSVGYLPLQLLSETSLPLVLVIDQVRMRWVPERVLRTGAVAAITLSVMSTPATSSLAAAAPTASLTVQAPDRTGDPVTDLSLALETAVEHAQETAEVDVDARVADASAASRGGGQGARAVAAGETTPTGAGSPTGFPQSVAPTQGVAAPAVAARAVAETTSTRSESKRETNTSSTGKKQAQQAAAPKRPPVRPPSGGASPSQVARAAAAAYAERQDLQHEQTKRANVQQSLEDLSDKAEKSQSAAIVIRDEVEAATLSHAEALAHAEGVQEAASGVGSIMPGGPDDVDVANALAVERSASERLEAAIETGAEVLDEVAATERRLDKTRQQLRNRKGDVQAVRADVAYAEQKAEVYKESLATSRAAPVAKGSYRLTARFGQGGGLWSSGVHTGLDFAGASGTPIMAAASGTVVATGYAGAYGNQIVIAHGNGVRTTYSHLSSISVSRGQQVSTGDRIGRMGSTGNSTGSHLHFEVTSNGTFQNPEAWLGW